MNKLLLIVCLILPSLSIAQANNHVTSFAPTTGIKFIVTDSLSNPIQNAKVMLYESQAAWRIDSGRWNMPVYTNAQGEVEITGLEPISYWFNIANNYRSNRFTTYSTNSLTSGAITPISVVIRDLSENELLLTGVCNNKTWITDSLILFGATQLYDADSKLLADGTWYDSNDNHGFWYYNTDESVLTYNYDSSSANGGGSTVAATNISLTDSGFVGDMTMFGMPVTYFMSALYDTINLTLSVEDTLFNLNGASSLTISPDNLDVKHSFCFPCEITLSQSTFTPANVGDNTITITLTDRCGNAVQDNAVIHIQNLALEVVETNAEPIRLFPNPAVDELHILGLKDETYLCRIKNTQGQTVMIMTIHGNQLLDISNLLPGMYIVEVGKNSRIMEYRTRILVH